MRGQGINSVTREIREVATVDEFRAAISQGEAPALLRGAVTHWTVTGVGAQGPEALAAHLAERATGLPVYTIVGQPEIQGQFGYRGDFSGLNFEARQTPLSAVLPHFTTASERGIAIAVQAAPALEVLRDWAQENPCDLVPGDVAPTLWLSSAGRVAPHSDIHDNVACVAGGRRRFTLFPPDQLENLYLGPLLDSPGGVPVSSVDGWDPDLQRHPRFAAALEAAQASTLSPGDAIFIPALWWHAVESLEALNLLINYWWGGTDAHGLSPYYALIHAALAVSQLPPQKRKHWEHYFSALVFRPEQEPGAHLPETTRDVITSPSEQQVSQLLQRLAETLGKDG